MNKTTKTARNLALTVAAIACGLAFAPAAQAALPCPGETITIAAANVRAAEDTLLCLVNGYRADSGLPALAIDPALEQAARSHSEDMATRDYFSHTSPEGVTPFARAIAAGFPEGLGTGENISFAAPATPREIFSAWKASPSHNAGMLDTDWALTGLGLAAAKGGAYATQQFGVSRQSAPVSQDGDQGTGTQMAGSQAPASQGATGPGTQACAIRTAQRDRLVAQVAAQLKRVKAAPTVTLRKRARTKLRILWTRMTEAAAAAQAAC